MFQQVRSFFYSKNILEVDTPILGKAAPIDEHIDIMHVEDVGYLHSSPEYGMKRLLSSGLGDMFQMSHVFRLGELSSRHQMEFTMIEWYRLHLSYEEFIQECIDLISLFLGTLSVKKISYRQLFLNTLSIDPFNTSIAELEALLHSHQVELSKKSRWELDSLLHVVFGTLIEPHLKTEDLLVVDRYPLSQAALAQSIQEDGHDVALRFEIYAQGIELANGYSELTDKQEQEQRLLDANKKRLANGKKQLPIDKSFLNTLSTLPSCLGVAVGFDRLMMLRHKTTIQNVVAFSWEDL